MYNLMFFFWLVDFTIIVTASFFKKKKIKKRIVKVTGRLCHNTPGVQLLQWKRLLKIPICDISQDC